MKNFKKNTRQIFKIVYNSLVICKKKKIGGLINMSKKEFVDAYAKATGETKKEIKIPAKKVVKFKVGKKLADSVAEGK